MIGLGEIAQEERHLSFMCLQRPYSWFESPVLLMTPSAPTRVNPQPTIAAKYSGYDCNFTHLPPKNIKQKQFKVISILTIFSFKYFLCFGRVFSIALITDLVPTLSPLVLFLLNLSFTWFAFQVPYQSSYILSFHLDFLSHFSFSLFHESQVKEITKLASSSVAGIRLRSHSCPGCSLSL